jgi:uncharacterized membrane protein YfhO
MNRFDPRPYVYIFWFAIALIAALTLSTFTGLITQPLLYHLAYIITR